ncbi:hypothetical protein EH165_05250 [Nakamurella antarctica]|uniref:Extradiol ring-cleavage dioxygenase class III enzyme subunit B domain-containing protein n=1 Tax=Nakamurella antarctica TaxID=1902245 RepID=A0A3G8ZUE9_9ACTN|nr:hypothetical protein [Nakamurella antarctica]AZI57646.1 hypothetical protein EH165_05250 [Nakamurella antarctica]
MIIGSVVWPSAPIFALHQRHPSSLQLPDSEASSLREIAGVMRASMDLIDGADRVVVVGPAAPRPVNTVASDVVATGSLYDVSDADATPYFAPSRTDRATAPSDGSVQIPSLPTSILVQLLRGWGYARPLTAIEVGVLPRVGQASLPTPSPIEVSDAMAKLKIGCAQVHALPERVVLVVAGDGAAAHGGHAPLAQDDRSAAFDLGVGEALRQADPAQLLAFLGQSAEHLPIGIQLASAAYFPLLALAALVEPGTARALSYGYAQPYGVGYHVAAWEVGAETDQQGKTHQQGKTEAHQHTP